MNYTNQELRKLSKEDLSGNWLAGVVLIIIVGLIGGLLRQIIGAFAGPNPAELAGIQTPTDIDAMAPYFMDVFQKSLASYGIMGLLIKPIEELFNVGISFGFLDMVDGAKLKLEYIIAPFTERFGRNILTAILYLIIIAVGYALLVIPGIIFTFMFMPVYYILRDRQDLDVVGVFKESKRLMKGHKFNYFKLILPYALLPLVLLAIITVLIVVFVNKEMIGSMILMGLISMILAAVMTFYIGIKIRALSAGYYRRNLAPIVVEELVYEEI